MKLRHILVFALLFILFFIEFPQIFAARSLDRISDFAHIIIFFIVVTMALKYFPYLKKLSIPGQFRTILIFTILIGLVIESLQFFSHRTPDIDDILRNILGACLGFVYWHRNSLKDRVYFKIVVFGLLFFVLFEFYFVVRAVTDDTRARINFPVLADFESGFEIDRWEGRADFEIDDKMAKSGNHSLKVTFLKNTFSDISLIHFPGDWRGYNALTFSGFNAQDDTVTIFIRIYDRYYSEEKVEEKYDRYNKQFLIVPGWNTVTIPLTDIVNAPKLRQMDLSYLTRIRIFTQFLPADRLVYLDSFKLN